MNELHECCPNEWRRIPCVTGSYEMDAVIAQTKNENVKNRLKLYCEQSDNVYGPKTAYNGYRGYSGDD